MPAVEVIIPSRQRVDTLQAHALTLFPDATVCVARSEADRYRRLSRKLLIHPDDVSGIGPLRAWIIAHAKTPAILMVDDDVSGLWSIVGLQKRRLSDPRDIRQVVTNTATCAADAGARVFGFSQSWDVRKFMPQKPLALTGWIGGAIGILGREPLYDTSLLLRADIDACLTSLLKHRIIYRDDRFAFEHKRFGGAGGNAAARSEAQHAKELAYLQRKWGAHLKLQGTKTTLRVIVDVPRTR